MSPNSIPFGYAMICSNPIKARISRVGSMPEEAPVRGKQLPVEGISGFMVSGFWGFGFRVQASLSRKLSARFKLLRSIAGRAITSSPKLKQTESTVVPSASFCLDLHGTPPAAVMSQ